MYEPPATCRKRKDGVETGAMNPGQVALEPAPWLGGRHKGGVTLRPLLDVGTCRLDAKGEIQADRMGPMRGTERSDPYER